MSKPRRVIPALLAAILPGVAGAGLGVAPAAAGGASPEIRLSPTNRVPSCANPERLTAFLRSRNGHLDTRFADIARAYREQGDAWRVRWDYAFFQMIVETNALSFRRGNGDSGDVKPRQNNFAGIGTTGGGVPGDSFPDVRTGVAAHIQHLVAYSGERLAAPVAPRTQLKQDDIVEVSRRLGRPVRFADLARRWAVDRRYWQSIEAVASAFRGTYCTTSADLAPLPEAKALALAAHKPHHPTADTHPSPSGLGGEPRIVREPSVARRPATPPNGATARGDRAPGAGEGRKSGPVRTVWRAGDLARRQVAAAAPVAAASNEIAATADVPQPPSAPQSVATANPTGAVPVTPQDTAEPRKFAFAGGFAPRAVQADGIASPPRPTVSRAAPSAGASPAPQSPVAVGCSITSASYGGRKALLIRSEEAGRVRFTALSVLDGFETSMAASYIRSHAPGGTAVGQFDSSDQALSRARELCGAVKLSAAQ